MATRAAAEKREMQSLANGAANQRQIKSIRNSFNNFFVTSKQQVNDHHQIKFRMSSVEHRNELKNYLELATLAADKPLHDTTISTKKTNNTIYKRPNPMVANDVLLDHRQMTNGFEVARKEGNNS